jgi:hypothetical protein
LLLFFFLLCVELSLLLLLLLLGIPSISRVEATTTTTTANYSFKFGKLTMSLTHLPVSTWRSTVSDHSSSFSVLFGLPDSFFMLNFKLEIPNKDITHWSCNNYLWRTRKLLKCKMDSKPDEIDFW